MHVRPVFDDRPVHGRPVYERPHDHRPVYAGGDCRVVVKKHVNHWGDMVVKRVRTCE